MKRIYLHGERGKGKYTIVDDDVYQSLMDNDINCSLSGEGYVRINIDQKSVRLNRFIVGEENIPKGKQVDHNNGNKLDNRRDNLRVCTAHQNTCNRKGMPSKYSEFKGVCKSGKNTCRARIQVKENGKIKDISRSFKNEIDAAIGYNKMARELHGEYARINTVPVPGTIGIKEAEQKFGKYIGDNNEKRK